MDKTLFFFILSFLLSTITFADKNYIYDEETSGKILTTKWEIDEESKKTEIVGEDKISTTKLKCSNNFEIFSFYFKSKIDPTEYLFTQEGEKLTAQGKVNNRPITKVHSLDLPWIQQFGFGLKSFVLSKSNYLKFCLLNPEDFSLQTMVATKEGIEHLNLDGKEYEAMKVTVTLPGFKSMFWKARLWFDGQDGDLLKYSANKGPNTPTTIITLKSEKKEGFFDKIEKSLHKEDKDNEKKK